MGTGNCRTWSKRRVTYTKEVIILASTETKYTSNPKNFDAIPMFQIEGIREMDNRPETPSKSNRTKDNDDDLQRTESSKNSATLSESGGKDRPFGHNTMVNFSHSIEINTSKDGINSGRSCYLKVSDAADCDCSHFFSFQLD